MSGPRANCRSAFDTLIGAEGNLLGSIELVKSAVLYPPNGLNTLITGPSINSEREFHQQLAGLTEVATTRVPLFQISYSYLEQMIAQLPAAAEVLAESYPDIIVWNSMTGSCLRGRETVNVLKQKTGVPVLAPSIEYAPNPYQTLARQHVGLNPRRNRKRDGEQVQHSGR